MWIRLWWIDQEGGRNRQIGSAEIDCNHDGKHEGSRAAHGQNERGRWSSMLEGFHRKCLGERKCSARIIRWSDSRRRSSEIYLISNLYPNLNFQMKAFGVDSKWTPHGEGFLGDDTRPMNDQSNTLAAAPRHAFVKWNWWQFIQLSLLIESTSSLNY